MKDLFGKEIKAGDVIAYAIGWGRGQLICIYRVSEFLPDGRMKAQQIEPFLIGHGKADRYSLLRHPERAVVLPEDYIEGG
jgi:hypothetical protein